MRRVRVRQPEEVVCEPSRPEAFDSRSDGRGQRFSISAPDQLGKRLPMALGMLAPLESPRGGNEVTGGGQTDGPTVVGASTRPGVTGL